MRFVRYFSAFALLLLSVVLNGQQTESGDSEQLTEIQSEAFEDRGCPIRSPVNTPMPLLSEEDQQLVRTAMNLDGAQRFPTCAYSAKSDTNRYGIRVEQYIPTDREPIGDERPSQIGWELISVEGKPPTQRQLNKYRHSGGTLYPHDELIPMLNFEKVSVVERNSERVVFETEITDYFAEDQGAGFLTETTTATFVVDLDTRRLDFVTVKLNAPIKPNAFMKVNEFDQYMDYTYVPEIGEVVLTELRMRADVKFVVVRKKFHLHAEIYDFSCPIAMQPVTCEDTDTTAMVVDTE